LWLTALLILALSVSMAFLCFHESRISRVNFERISKGMTVEQVTAIPGEGGQLWTKEVMGGRTTFEGFCWTNGPNFINVHFENGKVYEKDIHLATVWESIQWYAEEALVKIGITENPVLVPHYSP
jgi:hypothetical protein